MKLKASLIIASVLTFVLSMWSVPANAGSLVIWDYYYGHGYAKSANIYSNRSPSWRVPASGGLAAIVFQSDGNFVEYEWSASTGRYHAVWASGTNIYCKPERLAFQTDGNVVIYDCGGHARWSTGINNRSPGGYYLFRLQTNGCMTDQYYNAGWRLWWNPLHC